MSVASKNLVEEKICAVPSMGKITTDLSPFFSSIEINGFQSIEHLSLDLGQFSVIHGESDVGKSAFFRAFTQLFDPDRGDFFITHGKDKASVAVKLKSGDTVSWSKTKGRDPSYKLNEHPWRHVSGVPKDILNTLKISKVVVGDDSFRPGVQGQFDGLFLLFDSALKRAKTLGSIVSNILLSGIREANLERNRNESDIRGTEILLAELEKAEKVDWTKINEQILLCDSLLDRTKKLEDLSKDIGQTFLLSNQAERHEKVFAKYIVDFEGIEKVYKELAKATEFYWQVKDIDGQLQSILTVLKEKEVSVDATPLITLEKLVPLYADVYDLYGSLRLANRDYDLASKEEERQKGLVEKAEQDLKKAEQEFLLQCPYCRKKFSMLMIKE